MEYRPGCVADLLSGSTSQAKNWKEEKKRIRVVSPENFENEDQILQSPKKKKKKENKLQELEKHLNVSTFGSNFEVEDVNIFHTMPKSQSKKRKISESAVNNSSVHLEAPTSEKKYKKARMDRNLESNKKGLSDKSSDMSGLTLKGKGHLVPKIQRPNGDRLKLKGKGHHVPRIERPNEEESRTIFVKNLPNTMRPKEIRNVFKKYGVIETVRLRCAPLAKPGDSRKRVVIMRDFHPERTNICAFVRFKSPDSVDKALDESGSVLENHHIVVDRSLKQERHDQRKAVFLGNVPYAAEEDDLWNMFESCGEIADVRIVRDWKTGVGKGFAYINFKESSAVELALTLSGEKLKEREIRVQRAVKKPKVENKMKFQKTKRRIPSKKLKKKHKFEDKTKLKEEKDFPRGPLVSVPPPEDSHFQGQTSSDVKKKKKKLSKDDLKKKKIIGQLGLDMKKNKPRKRNKASE